MFPYIVRSRLVAAISPTTAISLPPTHPPSPRQGLSPSTSRTLSSASSSVSLHVAPRPLATERLQAKVVISGSVAANSNPPTAAPSVSSSSSLSTPSRPTRNFGSIPLSPGLVEALHVSGIVQPTEIQQLVIPDILKGHDIIFAAQTGTGKTLAYLLPVLERLHHEEKVLGVSARLNRPRALLLVPTRELADQVRRVAKFISHYHRFRCVSIIGGDKLSVQTRALSSGSGVDLLIATPGRCKELMASRTLFLSDVRYVIIDEADTLYAAGTGFAPLMRELLSPIQRRSSGAATSQFILSSASLLPSVLKTLQNEFPHAHYVATNTLHRTLPNLRESFITLRGTQNKLDVLVDVLSGKAPVHSIPVAAQPSLRSSSRAATEIEEEEEDDSLDLVEDEDDDLVTDPTKLGVSDDKEEEVDEDDGYTSDVSRDDDDAIERKVVEAADEISVVEPTIVFCNTVPSCRAVEHHLASKGLRSTSYHGLVPPKTRTVNFNLFISGQVPILVCTDIGARGLDTTFVKHVILFDFPLNPIDYLHRVGRTARAGMSGRVTSLIAKRDRVLAEAIRRARAAGTTIHTLSSDKRAYLPNANAPISAPPRARSALEPEALFKPRKPSRGRPDAVSSRRQHTRSFSSFSGVSSTTPFDPWESADSGLDSDRGIMSRIPLSLRLQSLPTPSTVSSSNSPSSLPRLVQLQRSSRLRF